MLSTENLEIMIGARTLLRSSSFAVQKGDKIGLVGANGAGKTTLLKILMNQNDSADTNGHIIRTSKVGYLPQDTQVGDVEQTALDRILSAVELDKITAKLVKIQQEMGHNDQNVQERAMKQYDLVHEQFLGLGGYNATTEATKITHALGLSEDVLGRKLRVLSGGQRRRVELARVFFSDAEILLLDEPTNHLDADSINWLRSFLVNWSGGFVMITHDTKLLDEVVNKVYHLDINRAVLDLYSLSWSRYLKQRVLDEQRRKKEAAGATKDARRLLAQGNKMRASATKAVAAQQMLKRAQKLFDSIEDEGIKYQVRGLNFPTPAPCSKTPLMATGLTKNYGSNEVFVSVDLVIDKGSKVVVLGLNGAGKTTLLKILAGVLEPDIGQVEAGRGLKIGYYAQEHDLLDNSKTVLQNMQDRAPANLDDTGVRSVLGAFMFYGDDVYKPTGVLSGGEKTRLALAQLVVSGANVLLLDEPTNNLDPQSRDEILKAIQSFEGAIVLVTHDPGATQALNPDRVLLLPDGDEDIWNDSYQELVELN
ncbi:MAG: ATP-binding cassette domain-containing protein [Candidatus Ancillula trichonymphae]|jgi:ATPase subunit of ABC transporter with duplicated ATPase domains|nr:ATP-binding cassette domain-containing protein [Candidatus Ancillula trichonymphae]